MTKPFTSIVRPYVFEDIDWLVETAAREVPSLPNYKNVVVDPVALRFLFEKNMDNKNFLTLVLCEAGQRIGGVVGKAGPCLFSFDVVVQDSFLWVDPDHRTLHNVRLLIHGYLNWAKTLNPTVIMASHTGGTKEGKMSQLLQREGFVPVGTLYHYRSEEL